MSNHGPSLVTIAQETLQIVRVGAYRAGGAELSVQAAVAAARAGTRLYEPDAVAALVAERAASLTSSVPAFEVTGETTSAASRRLLATGAEDVLALNFASAKNPGGGFLGGAKAQEEDLARQSALYDCLVTQPRYYEENRAFGSALYTDHLIYSPRVPFFRDDALALVAEPYLVSMITSPAPNAGALVRSGYSVDKIAEIPRVLARRAEHVLRVAEAHGHRVLVLGAWGCGAFHNDPELVARVWSELLRGPYAGAFERVVFAVRSREAASPNLRAFEQRFAPARHD